MKREKNVYVEYRIEVWGRHSEAWVSWGCYNTKAEAVSEYRELVQGEPEKHWRLIKTTWEELEHRAAVEC